MAGYYRRFIENFSKIAKPMTELLKNNTKFEWSEACERSFEELKRGLTTTPVLTLPIFRRISWYTVMLQSKGKSCGLCFEVAEEARGELPDTRLGVGSCCARTQDLEALPDGEQV
jgi:hypothetical protein